MRTKKYGIIFLIFLLSLLMTSCFNEKKSPFYESEWVMQNYDNNLQLYYHHMILEKGHKVTLRTSYADSENIMVWTGTYRLTSSKIIFKFEECSRFENGENVGNYNDRRIVTFYNGEFLYSLGLIGDDAENQIYHLALIRPKNQIYGETKDIYGNYFEEFVKISDKD